MRDGYGFNEAEMCFILSWFGVNQSILLSWGDISVLLLLWQCSWWCSSVPSGKSRFLMSLIGITVLLSTKCRGIVSWVFSSCGRHLVYILELRTGWPFETQVCSAKSGLLSSYDGYLVKLNYTWEENTCTSGGEPWGQASLISWHSYICIPINFHEESGIVTFWSIELSTLSKSQTDVRPSVQKRLGTMAFSRVSTGGSDIPSSCEMKHEPSFKALQGKPTFFWVRASLSPFHAEQLRFPNQTHKDPQCAWLNSRESPTTL